MTPSYPLQKVVTELVERSGRSLQDPDLYLKLELPGFERLVIESIGKGLISVAHYFEQNGDLVPDPDVVLYTGWPLWVPVEIQGQFGWRRVAWRDGGGWHFHNRRQEELARFCNQWARNLEQQGWLS